MRTGSRATRPLQAPKIQPPLWKELRDERGHLYGRINQREWLIELKRQQRVVRFDLRTGEPFDEE